MSEIFKVSHPLVTKIWKQYCIEGIVKLPEYKSGRKRKLDQEDVQHIHFLKQTKPSMPLKSVKEEVLKYSTAVIKVSESTISRHLKNDLNMTYKRIARFSKNRFTPQNMNYTQNFLNYVGQKDTFSLKFMDEGEPVFNPGVCLIAGNAWIHHNMAERELNNYLPTVGVQYVFFPTYPPD